MKAAALLAFGSVFALAACQTKASPVAGGFITADPGEFTIHSVDRMVDQQASTINNVIVVVSATFTNGEGLAEMVAPNHFILTDQSTNATYYGLSGGNINIPSMPITLVDPGKTAEIAVGFRVPVTVTSARLTYHP